MARITVEDCLLKVENRFELIALSSKRAKEIIKQNYKSLMSMKPDAIYGQFITPYPKTEVREEDCVGCSLCALVCPVDDCISMARIDDGSESKTWNELIKEFENEGKPLTWENLREFQKQHGIVVH